MSITVKRKPRTVTKSIIINSFEILDNAYYPVEEIAKVLKVKPDTIYKLIERQRFKTVKYGRCYQVSGKSVIDDVKRQEQAPRAKAKRSSRFSRPVSTNLPPKK
ncbi:MAG: helix-turn-helix domain-containing protein [Victivallaceae bacterium]|jgi:excisionase family DNA binding protein